jgi:hypothetical protein
LPKDIGMSYLAHPILDHVQLRPATPWSLRAWPLLLWQVGSPASVQFCHLDTRVTYPGDGSDPAAGQTLWSAPSDDGEAGMAWDWVQIARGVVAIADPMSVVTNVRLIGDEGEVLTAHAAARFLNELVRALPWQSEVRRALVAGGALTH